MCIYVLISGSAGGPAGQPPLDPNGKALSQPKPHHSDRNVKEVCDFQWQADRNCSKETPNWKTLEAV